MSLPTSKFFLRGAQPRLKLDEASWGRLWSALSKFQSIAWWYRSRRCRYGLPLPIVALCGCSHGLVFVQVERVVKEEVVKTVKQVVVNEVVKEVEKVVTVVNDVVKEVEKVSVNLRQFSTFKFLARCVLLCRR